MRNSMNRTLESTNQDQKVVEGFGDEWSRFDQSELDSAEHEALFQKYFHIFPWQLLPEKAVGFDLGCGSGRWAKLAASRVGTLHCIDASGEALDVAKRNLVLLENCKFHHASVDAIPLEDNSVDFGYSLGVLHHVPNTLEGIKACVAKLKPGAPFLLYLYYAFDNKPVWFRGLWKISEAIRFTLSRSPNSLRYLSSQVIAGLIYFPLARTALLLEKMGRNVEHFPLSFYRKLSFYVMRTDALDRFGTRLEQRFSRMQIKDMMETAGLSEIKFSENTPFWCAVGVKL